MIEGRSGNEGKRGALALQCGGGTANSDGRHRESCERVARLQGGNGFGKLTTGESPRAKWSAGGIYYETKPIDLDNSLALGCLQEKRL